MCRFTLLGELHRQNHETSAVKTPQARTSGMPASMVKGHVRSANEGDVAVGKGSMMDES